MISQISYPITAPKKPTIKQIVGGGDILIILDDKDDMEYLLYDLDNPSGLKMEHPQITKFLMERNIPNDVAMGYLWTYGNLRYNPTTTEMRWSLHHDIS